MKNQRLEAGRAYLKREGYDDIPDKIILGLFSHMEHEESEEYEPGDFVIWNEGMGEVGFGTISEIKSYHYVVDVHLYPGEAAEPYNRRVNRSDVFKLSTPEEADEYFNIRTGKIAPPYPVAKYKEPQ